MSNESHFEPLTLSIDTASGLRSLGVFRGAGQLSLHVSEQTSANSSTVLGDVDRVLHAAAVGVKEIELFALAVGPGSFTGLRAGLATVKALATTLRRRAVGVPTLHAVAHAAASTGDIIALIPAGRGEVFAQHLSLGADGSIFEHAPPTHVAPGELFESVRAIERRVTWAGAGAEKYRALIEDAARAEGFELVSAGSSRVDEGRRVWVFAHEVGPLAQSVAALAQAQYRRPEAGAGEHLRALYVRPADAKISGA